MVIHLRPRIFTGPWHVSLVDLQITPFSLTLSGGVDLMTGHPYPNKGWQVICRKKGKKAMDGILLDVTGEIDSFNYTVRWTVHGEPATHCVHCSILDHAFNAASDSAVFWCPTFDGTWSDRWPKEIARDGTMYIEPSMEVKSRIERKLPTHDVVNIDTGWISERTQHFSMPTIEEERLFLFPHEDSSRMPSTDDAFQVVAPRRPSRVPPKGKAQEIRP